MALSRGYGMCFGLELCFRRDIKTKKKMMSLNIIKCGDVIDNEFHRSLFLFVFQLLISNRATLLQTYFALFACMAFDESHSGSFMVKNAVYFTADLSLEYDRVNSTQSFCYDIWVYFSNHINSFRDKWIVLFMFRALKCANVFAEILANKYSAATEWR